MKKILIIGATSAIAEACSKLFATDKDQLYLLARNEERLSTLSKDLLIRGAASVEYSVFDVNDSDKVEQILTHAIDVLKGIDTVLIAHGTLPDQKVCEADYSECLTALNTNMISTIQILTILANIFEAQGHGSIVAISSVAGDRGRQSNYIYGTAKGAISIFMQGLRNRLSKKGVDVITIKPGFVDSPMTADFDKGPLWAKPDDIARGIIKAIEKGKNDVYLPLFWWPIMLIIKSIPEFIFKKMSL
ncbi:Oxidoreductase, short-chain dehydrogenase/reductase family [hydrothermal vent metagenome]|uniref:Oxidoreductase, short-chain dehydrogenase/reductase family n=1 Tax=hydrothermal vent metagenome TaxID=652676 RepID=A0A3B0XRV2_9ZZZZ